MARTQAEAGRRRRRALLALNAALALALAPGSDAQIPDEFTNLEVLPKEISKAELVGTMKSFTRALGVRCEHCHATKEGVDPTSGELEDLDFPSDAREAKVKARAMVKMVRAINTEHLAKLPGGAMIEVQCITCHRGVAEPETIEGRVERTIADDGIDAAVTDYRELREEYLQSGSYDFDEGPLRLVAERFLRGGKAKEARAVLELNLEFHADSARTHALLGDAHLALGDRTAARAAYARSLELEPGHPLVKKKLEELAPEPAAPPPPPRR